MNDLPTSIPDLISRWKTIGAFAAAVGCGYEAARKMRDRQSIAPEHWPAVVRAAEGHGVAGVTLEWLASQRMPLAPAEDAAA
jgi:hypothetical protein